MRRLLVLGSIAVLAASLMSGPAANATFGGENGRIVFVANSQAGRDILASCLTARASAG